MFLKIIPRLAAIDLPLKMCWQNTFMTQCRDLILGLYVQTRTQ